MQFTDKYIKNLQSKSTRYEVREGNGQGFGIRISTAGQKAWIFFYHFERRKRRLTLGNYPEISLAEARKKHQIALLLLAKGKDPGAVKQEIRLEIRQSPTVAALVQEYLEKWAKPRKRSWKIDARIFNKDVLPRWGNHKAKDITRRDIVLLLDSILERGSPIIVNRTLALVRRLFNFAIERDILTTTPCLAIKAPSKETRRDRMLTEDEIRNFWRGLDNAAMTEELKLLLKLMLATAQREGEWVNACWEDIDFKQQCLMIYANRAKNEHAHRVPLSSLAVHLLQQVRQSLRV